MERLEAGQSTQLANFVRILRVLGLLEPVLQALPEPGVSPMDLLELQSRKRQRARSRKSPGRQQDESWRWGDEE